MLGETFKALYLEYILVESSFVKRVINYIYRMHFPRSVWGLGNLLGKPVLVAKEYLTWALVKYVNSENCGVGNAENVLVAESYSKLNVALFLMHECFEILHNPYSSRDIVEEVIFNQR